MEQKKIIRIVLVTAGILLIPFVAMFFTDEVQWGLFDFAIIGALLLVCGFAYEFFATKLSNTKHKVIVAILLVVTLLIIWIDLAVGIFNIPGISGS
jgi:bacteriorhodopsin